MERIFVEIACPPYATRSIGIPAPTEYAVSNMTARASSVCCATSVSMEPKIGPAQGAHITPIITPIKNPPAFPLPAFCPARFAASISFEKRPMTLSNKTGHIMEIPKIASTTAAKFLSIFGESPRFCTRKLSASPKSAKVSTNPSVMKIGRVLFCCPTEAPRSMGKGRSMHGAASVRTPARIARRISITLFYVFL